MNTIERPIDESAAPRDERELAEFNLIIEIDDSQLQQVAGGNSAVIPTG
jgi:hypothetical protein